MKRWMKGLALSAMSLLLLLTAFPQAATVAARNSGEIFISVAPPQNQARSHALGDDLFGSVTSTAVSSTVGGFVDNYVNTQNGIRDSYRATASTYQHAFQASGKEKNFIRMVKAEDAASAANLRGTGANIAGKLYGGYCIANDVMDYNTASKHKHSSLALLDQTLRGINIIGGSLDYVGVKQAKPIAIVGGILKDTVGGDTFSDWSNQQDNFVLYGLDTTTDAVNDWTTYAFSYYMDLWNGTDDANVYGRPPYGAGVYKPNIYLYPEAEAALSVTFGLPALLTATLPDYHTQWQVIASPDGSLTNLDGNSACDYLFYESLTDPALFARDSGWILSASTREAQFREILAAYGFNEREISDFVAFWTEKLTPGTDYVIYPQLTAAVDGAMPITVYPAPANSFRLWFAFEAYPGGQAPTTPVVTAMDRDGYTLVEWGGFFLD